MNENYISKSARLIQNKLGEYVTIWNYTDISDSVLKDGVVISDFSQLRNSVINEYVDIGRRNTIHFSEIGKNTYTGEFCVIKHCKIGKYCAISWNVSIGGANHDIETLSVTPVGRVFTGKRIDYKSFNDEINIGNDVWIAAGAHILRGITIGNGAVIGANAVVTHDVEPYSIVAGVPAKVIGKRCDDLTIERLLKIRWWDLPDDILADNDMLFGTKLNEEILVQLEQLRSLYDNNGNR